MSGLNNIPTLLNENFNGMKGEDGKAKRVEKKKKLFQNSLLLDMMARKTLTEFCLLSIFLWLGCPRYSSFIILS